MPLQGEGWTAQRKFSLSELPEGLYRFERVPEETWVLEPGVYAFSPSGDEGIVGGIVVVDEPMERQKIVREIGENLTPSDVDEERP